LKYFFSFVFAIVAPALFIFMACMHQPVKSQTTKTKEVLVKVNAQQRTVSSNLSFHPATENQIKNAICKNPVLTTTKDIEKYFSQLPQKSEESSSFQYGGITFENENASLMQAFADLTRSADPDDKTMATSDLQNKYHINPSCKKILCAVQTIFGKTVGPKMLYLMQKYQLNTSALAWKNASLMTDDEITDVLRTLSYFPSQIFPMKQNQKLIKFLRGYTLADDAPTATMAVVGVTNGLAQIWLYDAWSDQSSENRQQYLFHEFSHALSYTSFEGLSGLDSTNSWNKAGLWENKSKTVDHHAISGYGNTNAAEDFAEDSVAYRFHPQLLKTESPVKYQYMKFAVYDGLEYTSPKECTRPATVTTWQKKITESPPTFSQLEMATIGRNCQQEAYVAILGHLPYLYFQQCVDYEATVIWAQKLSPEFGDVVPRNFINKDLHHSELYFPFLYLSIAKQAQAKVVKDFLTINNNAIVTSDAKTVQGICTQMGALKVFAQVERDPDWLAKNTWNTPDIDNSGDSGTLYGDCMNLYQGSTDLHALSPAPVEAYYQKKIQAMAQPLR